MSNKLKLNKLNILKLNNQTYLPFLIHNLPNNYNKFPLNTIIKIGTTIYINTNNFTNKFINNFINTLNFSNINKNNIK
jgi:ribosome biogenesis protein Tsr3